MLFYSHVWDGLLKLTSLVLVFLVVVVFLQADKWLPVPIMIGSLLVLWILIYRQGLSTIASLLYARVNLGTEVSLSEARQLARLFQLDLSMTWVPLNEIKWLPKADRRNALLAALETPRPERKSMLF